MIFSDKYKYLGICIPKTGSTSLQSLFGPPYGDVVGAGPGEHHMDLTEALRRFPKAKNYFKFTFVRNPYDRIISFYHHFAHVRGTLLEPDSYRPAPRYHGYHDFLNRILDDKLWKDDLHFKPQYTFIDVDQMDFIGRFENFENDINHIFQMLNMPKYIQLPHDRKSNYTGKCDCPYPTRGFFDTKSANNMYKYFQNDFDLFGYDKSDWETSLYLSQMRSFLASLPILGV